MLPKLFAVAICATLPLFAVKQRVELITTDHADFAAGGLIHIEGSTGELNIAGWDQPSVEVIATRQYSTTIMQVVGAALQTPT